MNQDAGGRDDGLNRLLAHNELKQIELLEWLGNQVSRDLSAAIEISISQWAEQWGVSEVEVDNVVGNLLFRAWVEDRRIDQKIVVSLTWRGRDWLDRCRAMRRNRAARNAYVRNTILHWLYDRDGQSIHALTSMIDDPQVHFYGERLSVDEVGQACTYLVERQMLQGVRAVGGAFLRPALLARGIECVESGKSVSDFINAQQSGGGNTYHTYLPNAQGVIVGEQQNFTQNNTVGVDPTKFIQLAGYVGQISGTLGLDEPERVELERMAQELHEEASAASPEVSRLRALGQTVKEKLMAAATTVAAQIGIQMAEGALDSLIQ